MIQQRAPVALDIGTIPADQVVAGEPGNDQVPLDTLSRIYAHIGHRLPLVSRIEKRLEGQDKAAGIGSDFAALVVDLFRRNEAVIQDIVTNIVTQQRAARENAVQPGTAQSPEPEVHA